jgi:hypothetical protein
MWALWVIYKTVGPHCDLLTSSLTHHHHCTHTDHSQGHIKVTSFSFPASWFSPTWLQPPPQEVPLTHRTRTPLCTTYSCYNCNFLKHTWSIVFLPLHFSLAFATYPHSTYWSDPFCNVIYLPLEDKGTSEYLRPCPSTCDNEEITARYQYNSSKKKWRWPQKSTPVIPTFMRQT